MSKEFSLFINFGGECREAAAFYARVFESEVEGLMAYGDAPPDEGYEIPEKDKQKVMFCSVPIFGRDIMFSDNPSGMPLIKGNNISPTLVTNDADEIRRVYAALQEGGEVQMELQKTFWSELYGMVQDKYGIVWQLSQSEANV